MTADLHSDANRPISRPASRPMVQTRAKIPGLPKDGARSKGLSRPWEFMWNPARWGYSDEAGGWHPRLAQNAPMKGSRGLTESGGLERVLADLEVRGWKIIEIGDPRLGKFAEYILEHQVKGSSQPQYVPMWCEPIVIGNKTRWQVDRAMYREFLQHLVTSGIVPPPHPLIKEDLILRQQEAVRRCEGDLMENQGSSLFVSRLQDQRTKLARMTGEDEGRAQDEVRELAKIAAQQAADVAQAHADKVAGKKKARRAKKQAEVSDG